MPIELAVPDDALRRVPQQARSRKLLARVLEAADVLLADQGPDSLTTTRVAAAAGVAVGSLYQYLPDRTAIIEALAAAYLQRFEATMAEMVTAAYREQWDDPAKVLIDAFADVYRTEPGYRALWFSRHLTETARAADRQHNERMAVTLKEVLLAQVPVADSERLLVACRTAQLMADGVMQEAFRADPEGDPALLREITSALRAYMREFLEGNVDE
ncbi:putative TetR family transcriptional regulator [Gordonia effusa NBRC 100432]|uniref:Putative TetR family transcriptional regulator n=1 Tax=Gordonia effusa NBRC 100432 TaxID=1077974 RepID=H0R6J3_9ACTN|nr:TetR family transcriptional regulator [Gordonia effusa]GAB20694.1 putative TetR family transcriptional regulator [Gordonia effusa NBRC 100432]